MARILVLDPHLAAKIAAGEVIERPGSVVKELVENALDAGATAIHVEIVGGGMERILVADDGCGIAEEDVELAFRRHATSKLREEDDLGRLRTLGFRGEALPSIAAVADVTCATRAREADVGLELRIVEGSIEREPIGRPAGTTLTVDGLFGRFPARRKFLRSKSVEASACAQMIAPLALAFPDVRLNVVVDGRTVLSTSGDGSLRNAAAAVLGSDAAPHLIDVPDTSIDEDGHDGPVVRVTGLCASGSYHRSGRAGLHLLLNHRPIQNRALGFAVHEAYGSLLPVGRHPVAVVAIEVPPSEVDFNVHPSKLEVKLLRERAVYAAVQRALRNALASGAWDVPEWGGSASSGPESLESSFWTGVDPPPGHTSPGSPDQVERQSLLSDGERLEDLRILGQAGRMYVIAEGDAGLYLVDQHAAHERVLLEELRAGFSSRVERQLMLTPEVVELAADAAALADQVQDELSTIGFDVELFGPRQVLVRAVPAVIANRQPGRALAAALSALGGGSHGLHWGPEASWAERLALVLACKTAVRAGDSMTEPEMLALLRRLGEAALCRTCAHGRPTAILLSHSQLARQFGRG